ncbi:MAG: hypothetical protein AAB348_01900 [Patescibacteria group bacterium]
MAKHNIENDFFESYTRPADTSKFPSAEISEFAHELSSELKRHFQDVVRNSLAESDNVSEAVKQKIVEQMHDTPSIEMYDGMNHIKSRLKDFSYAGQVNKINKNEILLVIQLPEPMKQWPLTKGADQIDWQNIYLNCIDRLWATMREFAASRNLYIDRINPVGVHRQDNGYYYLWLVCPSNRKNAIEQEYPDDQPLIEETDY